MSDYSFMKSGSGNGTYQDNSENNLDKKTENDILSLILVFIEDATKLSVTYSNHANRNKATVKDLSLALKVRAFHGDEFWNLPDVQEKIQSAQDFINEEEEYTESNEDEDMEISNDDADNMEAEEEEYIEFSLSSCTCKICKDMNEIDSKWGTWEPTDNINKILKKHINEIE